MGLFRLAVDANDAIHTGWEQLGNRPQGGCHDPALREDLAEWILRYLEGEQVILPPFRIPKTSAFRARCLNACRLIPSGETVSYAAIAEMAQSPRAARAVGSAMRHNMTPLLVPCHRVIRSCGTIGGFAGCKTPGGPGAMIKVKLLQLEGFPVLDRCGQGILPVSGRFFSG